MKILMFSWESYNYHTRQELWINGKQKKRIGPLCECPEDAIIGRNLVDCEDLIGFIELGHKAKDELLEIEYINADPDEIYETDQWNDLVTKGFVS